MQKMIRVRVFFFVWLANEIFNRDNKKIILLRMSVTGRHIIWKMFYVFHATNSAIIL